MSGAAIGSAAGRNDRLLFQMLIEPLYCFFLRLVAGLDAEADRCFVKNSLLFMCLLNLPNEIF